MRLVQTEIQQKVAGSNFLVANCTWLWRNHYERERSWPLKKELKKTTFIYVYICTSICYYSNNFIYKSK